MFTRKPIFVIGYYLAQANKDTCSIFTMKTTWVQESSQQPEAKNFMLLAEYLSLCRTMFIFLFSLVKIYMCYTNIEIGVVLYFLLALHSIVIMNLW